MNKEVKALGRKICLVAFESEAPTSRLIKVDNNAKPTKGVIQSIGSDVESEDFKVGDHVIFSPTAGKEIKYKQTTYIMLRPEEVFVSFEPDNDEE